MRLQFINHILHRFMHFYRIGNWPYHLRFKISGTLSATDLGSWRTIQKGVEQRKISFLRSEPNYTLELKLLRFDPKFISARVLSSGDFHMTGTTAKSVVEKSGAIAAIAPLAAIRNSFRRDEVAGAAPPLILCFMDRSSFCSSR